MRVVAGLNDIVQLCLAIEFDQILFPRTVTLTLQIDRSIRGTGTILIGENSSISETLKGTGGIALGGSSGISKNYHETGNDKILIAGQSFVFATGDVGGFKSGGNSDISVACHNIGSDGVLVSDPTIREVGHGKIKVGSIGSGFYMK